MGFSIGSDEFDSLALGDTPLEALMLGDVELWSAGEPAPAGVTPALIESTGPVTLNQSSSAPTVLATHTVVGSGYANVDFTCNFPNPPGGSGMFWRRIRVYNDGVNIEELPTIGRVSGTQTRSSAPLYLEDGDVLTFTGHADPFMNELHRTLNWWTLSLIPLNTAAYGFTQELGPGFAATRIADGEVATHVIQDYTGIVGANFTTYWTNSSNITCYHEVLKNGTRLTQQVLYRGSEQVTSTTILTEVVPGDELMFRVSVGSSDSSVQEYDNVIITID